MTAGWAPSWTSPVSVSVSVSPQQCGPVRLRLPVYLYTAQTTWTHRESNLPSALRNLSAGKLGGARVFSAAFSTPRAAKTPMRIGHKTRDSLAFTGQTHTRGVRHPYGADPTFRAATRVPDSRRRSGGHGRGPRSSHRRYWREAG